MVRAVEFGERIETAIIPPRGATNANVEITGRDLREKTPLVGKGNLFAETAA